MCNQRYSRALLGLLVLFGCEDSIQTRCKEAYSEFVENYDRVYSADRDVSTLNQVKSGELKGDKLESLKKSVAADRKSVDDFKQQCIFHFSAEQSNIVQGLQKRIVDFSTKLELAFRAREEYEIGETKEVSSLLVDSPSLLALEADPIHRFYLLYLSSCELLKSNPPSLKCLLRNGGYAHIESNLDISQALLTRQGAYRRRIPCRVRSFNNKNIYCSNQLSVYEREAHYE